MSPLVRGSGGTVRLGRTRLERSRTSRQGFAPNEGMGTITKDANNTLTVYYVLYLSNQVVTLSF